MSKKQTTCQKCSRTQWDKEYKEEKALKKKTPVECQVCKKSKLPAQFDNEYVPTVCKVCAKTAKAVKEAERKNNAVPGLIEVQYGELDPPLKDGGSGYAYDCDEPVALGDIVAVPQTWVGELRGEQQKLATVVSTYSDYTGPTSSVIRVVKSLVLQETL
tara:strand:- start:480 stop:956 length:477 start_codon:yes stop_codon:yes gene_type:complete